MALRNQFFKNQTSLADARVKVLAPKAAEASMNVPIGVKIEGLADPHSSWQRGTKENVNALLRQYLPKGRMIEAIREHAL